MKSHFQVVITQSSKLGRNVIDLDVHELWKMSSKLMTLTRANIIMHLSMSSPTPPPGRKWGLLRLTTIILSTSWDFVIINICYLKYLKQSGFCKKIVPGVCLALVVKIPTHAWVGELGLTLIGALDEMIQASDTMLYSTIIWFSELWASLMLPSLWLLLNRYITLSQTKSIPRFLFLSAWFYACVMKL